eukprot:gene772-523_t
MADQEMDSNAASSSAVCPPVGAGSGINVGRSAAQPSDGVEKRFEIKKWNAVALWAWDIVVDNCAICRNHIMD